MVRLKHRYLLLNILYPPQGSRPSKPASQEILEFYAPTPAKFTDHILRQLIRESVADLFGDYGVGKIHGFLKVVYFSPATSTAIVRVPRDHFRLVWAALSFITKLPHPFDTPCVIQVVRNSGTIRLAEEEAIKRAREFVRRARAAGAADGGLESILKTAVEAEVAEIGNTLDDGDDMSLDEDG